MKIDLETMEGMLHYQPGRLALRRWQWRRDSADCQSRDLVTEAFKKVAGSFVGAGTSGRLGILDASECSPTLMCP
jgi:hypothetical protein